MLPLGRLPEKQRHLKRCHFNIHICVFIINYNYYCFIFIVLCNVSGFGAVVYLRTGSNGFKLTMRNERVTDVHSRRRYDLKSGYFTFLLRRLGRMYLSPCLVHRDCFYSFNQSYNCSKVVSF